MLLAQTQLELLGHSSWWIAIGLTAGVALWIYAWLNWRLKPAPAASTPAKAATTAAARPPGPLFGRIPLALAAAFTGTLALAGTLLLAYLTARAHPTTTSLVIPLFLLVTVSAAVFLFYRGVYTSLTRPRRAVLFTLRVLGMLALVALLFRPVLAIVQGPAATKPLLHIVVDASASMGYNDAPNQPNRFRQSVLAIENTLIPRLENAYRIEVFAYDSQHDGALAGPGELDSILPNGNVTDLGAAIAAAGNSASDTILFSDGIHNGPVGVDSELARMGGSVGKIHTVRVGSSDTEPSSVPDIAVVAVDGPQTAIVNNQVTLTASIKSTAMGDRTVRVMLNAKDATTTAKPLDEQRLVLRSTGGTQSVQLHFTPDKVGRAVVRVQVPVDPSERSDANNQQDFALLLTDPKLTVLYVEGRVRPEVRPLRRTLEQDPNLALVSMVQTVAGRFEMTGLKTGGGGDDLKGLPTTLAQWKRFKVVVLGDLDASFMNTQQQRDLEQVVRDGAGLLMIGGSNSFAPGGWGNTTLAALMPVSLEKLTPAQINTPFVPQLTSVGAAHPIFRNIASYFLAADGRRGPGERVPELSGCVALGPPKAGASVLAVHPKENVAGQPATVLAVQQYGKGRTAALAADTTYLWSLSMRALGKESPYDRFWGQMIRWLASQENLEKKTGASVTAMLAKERFESGEPVAFRAAVTDKDGQATQYAQAWADVISPDGKTTRIPLAPKGTEAGQVGIYESQATAYKPTMAGTHKVIFGATKDNADLGKDETNFLVMPAAGERDILAAQPRTLETIARLTNGTAVDLPAVEALADRLLAATPPPAAATTATIPLSRPRWFFGAFVGLIALEWLLRRKWQLQ
jgi:uncharacterized membrane protein